MYVTRSSRRFIRISSKFARDLAPRQKFARDLAPHWAKRHSACVLRNRRLVCVPMAHTPALSYDDAAALLACVLRESRSADDLSLLRLYRAAAELQGSNTFVEIGAFDGESGSQTWLLEQCFGWRGLLIEANPSNYEQLEHANRSRSTKVWSAVCPLVNGSSTGSLKVTTSGGAVAGAVATMSPTKRKQWEGVLGNVSVDVPCAPLPHIMRQAGFERATLLSLDVEGAEKFVLDTVPSHEFPFDVVLVEANNRHHDIIEARKINLVDQMIENGGLRRSQLQTTKNLGPVNHLFARPLINSTSWAAVNVHIHQLVGVISRYQLSPSLRQISSKSAWAREHVAGWVGSGLPEVMPALLSSD